MNNGDIIISYYQWLKKLDYWKYIEIQDILDINTEKFDYLTIDWCKFRKITKNTEWINIIENNFIDNYNYISKNRFLTINKNVNHNGWCYLWYTYKDYEDYNIEENDDYETKLEKQEIKKIVNCEFFPTIGDKDSFINIKFIKNWETKKGKTIFKLEILSNIEIDSLLENIYKESEKKKYETIRWFNKTNIIHTIYKYKYVSKWEMYENIAPDWVSSYITQLASVINLINWWDVIYWYEWYTK